MKPGPAKSIKRIVRVDPRRPGARALAEAARMLRAGGVVAFPTETYYGLAVDPFNAAAVERLFRIKGRDPSKPVSLVIDDAGRLGEVAASVSKEAEKLIRKFWPGPLTLIFTASPRLPEALTAGTDRVGVRVPSHPAAIALLRAFGGPLTATSANPSGEPGAETAADVQKRLGAKLDLILDAGATPGGPESTVADATLFPPRLIREGRIPFRDLLEALGLSATEAHEW